MAGDSRLGSRIRTAPVLVLVAIAGSIGGCREGTAPNLSPTGTDAPAGTGMPTGQALTFTRDGDIYWRW